MGDTVRAYAQKMVELSTEVSKKAYEYIVSMESILKEPCQALHCPAGH
jgi:hypothetical protein